MSSPLGGTPLSERIVLRWPSIVSGLKRQNSDSRNQGSNQFRSRLTCATAMDRPKLFVLVTFSDSVVEPLALPPSLKEPQPIEPLPPYLVLLPRVSSSTWVDATS